MITPHEEYQESDQYGIDFCAWVIDIVQHAHERYQFGIDFCAWVNDICLRPHTSYQASPAYADNYQRWLNDQNDEITERRRQADRDDHLIRGDE